MWGSVYANDMKMEMVDKLFGKIARSEFTPLGLFCRAKMGRVLEGAKVGGGEGGEKRFNLKKGFLFLNPLEIII